MFVMKRQDERKDMFRVNSEKDIPENLRDTVWIKNGKVECVSAEGPRTAPLGTAFGSDDHAPTATGKGAWPMSEDAFEEKDGKFYSAKEVRTAELIDTSGGPVTIDTTWGPAAIGQGEQGYFITRPNGENHILNMDTSTADVYLICTKDGEALCPLADIKGMDKQQAEKYIAGKECEKEIGDRKVISRQETIKTLFGMQWGGNMDIDEFCEKAAEYFEETDDKGDECIAAGGGKDYIFAEDADRIVSRAADEGTKIAFYAVCDKISALPAVDEKGISARTQDISL